MTNYPVGDDEIAQLDCKKWNRQLSLSNWLDND